MYNPSDAHARTIEGSGTPDQAWLAWSGLEEIPAVSAHVLVPPGSRTVIVAPHPDDEILACGGLLQLLAAQGREMLFIAVTDGDASHPDSPLWPQERLRRVRPQESAQALQVLGLTTPAWLRLHLPDGGVTGLTQYLSATLAAHLLPGDTVLSTWRLDGHPDHEACGWACASACSASGATLVEMPVWGWHWAAPGDARVPWHRAHRLPVPVPVLQRKRAALRCFASQMLDDPSTGRPAIVAGDALQRLLHPWEVYFL